jgi:hypothetical protein
MRTRAGEGARVLRRLWRYVRRLPNPLGTRRSYNLDKRPVVISLFGELADAIRRSG